MKRYSLGTLLLILAGLQVADVVSTLVGFHLGADEASPTIVAYIRWAAKYVSHDAALVIGLLVMRCWIVPTILAIWLLKRWIAGRRWAFYGFSNHSYRTSCLWLYKRQAS
jgi:hypothetical protein